MRFIDPKTDFAFKRIFGSEDSKEVIISFINAALGLRGERKVASVEIKNPYLSRDLPIDRSSIVDVSCVDGTGIKYLVEMQVEKVQGFANRMIYDLSKCHADQLIKGEDYPKLNDVVLIAVMDFSLFEDIESYRSLFLLRKEIRGKSLNQLRLCCLELAKFNKKENELSGILDKWAYFLKEAGRLETRPQGLSEKVFDEAFEKAQVANLSKKEKDVYDVSIQLVMDKRGMIAEGFAQGFARGLAESREKTEEEIAIEMLKEGCALELIGKCTGLSREQIENLREKM